MPSVQKRSYMGSIPKSAYAVGAVVFDFFLHHPPPFSQLKTPPHTTFPFYLNMKLSHTMKATKSASYSRKRTNNLCLLMNDREEQGYEYETIVLIPTTHIPDHTQASNIVIRAKRLSRHKCFRIRKGGSFIRPQHRWTRNRMHK